MKKTTLKNKTSITRIIVFTIFIIYTFIIIIPYIYGLSVSMKTRAEYLNNSVLSLPSRINFNNYIIAWKELSYNNTSFISMFINSLWYSIGRVIIGLFLSSMVAYVVAKYRFPGQYFIYMFAIITMMIPNMGAMASNLKLMSLLGAYNSPWFAVVSAQILSGAFIIFFSTFKAVSWGYAEAAFIDGAGNFHTYFVIMLPQIFPVIIALFLSEFITMWTDSATPLIYFPDLPTLASGLFLYQESITKDMNYPVFFAGLMMCMIPTVVLYLIFQDRLMDIQLGGGLKG